MAESTALAVVGAEKFEVLKPSSEAAELLRVNIGNEGIGIRDLDVIKVPSGNSPFWSVPELGGVEAKKFLEGIPIYVGRRRAYWSNPDPSGDPPDCSSDGDCVKGVGNPGGLCEECPLNVFGTAPKKADGSGGRGKACKEASLVFLLQETSMLPIVIAISPASLQRWKKYRLALKVPFYKTVTRFSLGPATNKDSIDYCEVLPELRATLSPEAAVQVENYVKNMQGMFSRVKLKQDDV